MDIASALASHQAAIRFLLSFLLYQVFVLLLFIPPQRVEDGRYRQHVTFWHRNES